MHYCIVLGQMMKYYSIYCYMMLHVYLCIVQLVAYRAGVSTGSGGTTCLKLLV